jgi:hypothetical protein
MNVARECESKSPQGHRYRDMRRGYTRRVTQAKVLVTYVKRESHDADEEGQSVPGDPHRIRRRPRSELTECKVDDKVRQT